ncbi:MAG: hypothetical protein QG580_310 [Patescibacteria group bacterium]|jgi:hypothetical protein|nr:hypothetical protein [Patescibacteria group bacterium]
MQETTIILLVSVLQVILALGLINVWLVRFRKPTKYRGRGAHNMKEEFSAYGLPSWFMYVVGFLKLGIAFVLIAGLFVMNFTYFVLPSLQLLAVLMVGAIFMHIKVKDTLTRSIPAVLMLSMSVLAIILIKSLS